MYMYTHNQNENSSTRIKYNKLTQGTKVSKNYIYQKKKSLIGFLSANEINNYNRGRGKGKKEKNIQKNLQNKSKNKSNKCFS